MAAIDPGSTNVRGKTLRIAISCFGAGVAVWLLPATVEIVAWPSSGPGRMALVPALSRLWLLLAAAMAAAAVLVFAGPSARAQRATRARVAAPLSILWLWAVPFLPWLSDRAPLLMILAGPLRWLVAVAAVGGMVARLAAVRGWRLHIVTHRKV